jgi:hypothetical protein
MKKASDMRVSEAGKGGGYRKNYSASRKAEIAVNSLLMNLISSDNSDI